MAASTADGRKMAASTEDGRKATVSSINLNDWPKSRFVWFRITQALLLLYLLFISCTLVYVRIDDAISLVPQLEYLSSSALIPAGVELVLLALTIVPQAVVCALYRQRPSTWLWIDFGIGFLQLCLCVLLLRTALVLKPLNWQQQRIAIESALLLTVALRLYVRQVVHSDIGRSGCGSVASLVSL
jgi:hypothetical protein